MENITIKKATIHDSKPLQKISRQTFYETFSQGNTKEDMEQYLDTSFSEEKLTAELALPNSTFYFALLDEKVIGYLKINFGSSQTELQDNNTMEIERIYVLQA